MGAPFQDESQVDSGCGSIRDTTGGARIGALTSQFRSEQRSWLPRTAGWPGWPQIRLVMDYSWMLFIRRVVFLRALPIFPSARFQAGRAVRRGDVIALSGDSGNAMGAHLHYEVRYRGRAVDPMRIVVGTKSEGP